MELFYERLEFAMQTYPTHWNTVVEVFNAKLGQKKELDEVYIGRFGIDQRHERGDMLDTTL